MSKRRQLCRIFDVSYGHPIFHTMSTDFQKSFQVKVDFQHLHRVINKSKLNNDQITILYIISGSVSPVDKVADSGLEGLGFESMWRNTWKVPWCEYLPPDLSLPQARVIGECRIFFWLLSSFSPKFSFLFKFHFWPDRPTGTLRVEFKSFEQNLLLFSFAAICFIKVYMGLLGPSSIYCVSFLHFGTLK